MIEGLSGDLHWLEPPRGYFFEPSPFWLKLVLMILAGCYPPPDLGGSCCLGRGPAAGLFPGLASPQEMRWATGIVPRGVGPSHEEGE